MNPVNPVFSPYGYGGPYNPMAAAPMQRLAEMEHQYPQFANNNQNSMNMNQQQAQQSSMMNSQNFVKCRAVTSEDEARAAMIDLDGSIHVFTDIGNKKIYTKQINLDGTATLNVYKLEGVPEQKNEPRTDKRDEIDLSGYVRQKDLENVCHAFNSQICDLEDRIREYEKAIEVLQEEKKAAAKGGKKQ